MSDIVLSGAVRKNLLALQNTADLLGRTQERLATGLKVNSALDDPTAFFTVPPHSRVVPAISRVYSIPFNSRFALSKPPTMASKPSPISWKRRKQPHGKPFFPQRPLP